MSRPRIDILEPRRLFSAHVFGYAFADLNGNLHKDSGEPVLAGAIVFDDANNNGHLDAGEFNTTTDNTGRYDAVVPAGVHHGVIVAPAGYKITNPSSGKITAFLGDGANIHFNPALQTKVLADIAMVFNIYDLQRTTIIQSAIDALAPHVRDNDVFLLVSGNNTGAPSIANITTWANNLHARFPKNDIWVLTSGLTNVESLASARSQIPASVSTIVYDYEPSWPNEPEFSWDFATTISNFTSAAKAAHDGGFKLLGAATGRPLLEPGLQQYNWDYAKLEVQSGADGMLVQTQTWAHKSLASFKDAMGKLATEQAAASVPPGDILPQLTLDTQEGNGITTAQAIDAANATLAAGFNSLSLWFSPARIDDAVNFLAAAGR